MATLKQSISHKTTFILYFLHFFPAINFSGSCGIPPPVNYIVGGSPTNEGNWPWQVSIITSSHNHTCGGVLIDKYWVLTAAHCVDVDVFKITDLFVVLGEFDLNRRSENEQLLWIKQIIVHPNFSRRGDSPHDVALIQLEYDAYYNEYVSPICLPSFNDVYSSKSCSITGWGETKGTGDRSRLRVLNVTLRDVFECRNLTWMNLHPRLHICVNYGQTGSCHGDSGSPLSCARSDGRFFVEGVASWASPSCRDLHYASIYTNIWEYVPWIYRIMSSN